MQARETLLRSNKELDRLVELRTAELCQTIQELEQFAYALTHDLRSPLRAIQGYATFIQEEGGTQPWVRSLEYARRIQSAANRMDDLVRDALQYHGMLQQRPSLQPIDLVQVLRDLIESYPDLAQHKVPPLQNCGKRRCDAQIG